MSISPIDIATYVSMNNYELFGILGKEVKKRKMSMLPGDESRNASDSEIGLNYFRRQVNNIQKIYCNAKIQAFVKDEHSRDITFFVAGLIDVFSSYFGVIPAAIILIQIHKIGVDRFCDNDELKKVRLPLD